MIIHLVLFKLKPECLERKEEIISKLNALGTSIPSLNEIKAGDDFNRSEAAFDIGLYTSFNTKEDLATYQAHPEHQKIVEIIKATTSDRAVTDFIV